MIKLYKICIACVIAFDNEIALSAISNKPKCKVRTGTASSNTQTNYIRYRYYYWQIGVFEAEVINLLFSHRHLLYSLYTP